MILIVYFRGSQTRVDAAGSEEEDLQAVHRWDGIR